MVRRHPVWASESEFNDFLRRLEKICASSEHVVISSNGELKFHYCVLETSLGPIDVFRYQRREAWDSGEPSAAQIGQGMFRYDKSTALVNDLCDSGYKYILPNTAPSLYSATSAPGLEEVVKAVEQGKNVSEKFTWKGPYNN